MTHEVTMKLKSIVTYILLGISLTCILLASGIKEVANWWDIAKPFFAVWFITLVIALVISNINVIRRFTYPATICVYAWLYGHNLLRSKFSRNTHRVYVAYGSSYSKLYNVVQDAFDQYLEASKS